MGNSNGKPVVFTDEGKHTNTLSWLAYHPICIWSEAGLAETTDPYLWPVADKDISFSQPQSLSTP